MHQRGSKTTVPSGGQTSSNAGPNHVLGPQHQPHFDCSRFNEWIDLSLDPTETEISQLVTVPSTFIRNNQKRCCKNSSSSGYSSHHSPALSAGSRSIAACYGISGLSKNSAISNSSNHQQHTANRPGCGQQQNVGAPGLAVIHEADTIPRPIWPCMGDDQREIHESAKSPARCNMIDCEVAAAHAAAIAGTPDDCRQDNTYACCGYCCGGTTYAYHNSSSGPIASTTSTNARQVLLELSRTLNSVIDADSDLSAEDILRDISITVARGIGSKDPSAPPSSGICEDYTYRLSSSSSSGGGKESVGVNPVNLRVYSKPKWLHVPASSRSSSHCPYEGKTLLAAVQHASPTLPAFGNAAARVATQRKSTGNDITPGVFLVPERRNKRNCVYPSTLSAYCAKDLKAEECKGTRNQDLIGTGHFEEHKRASSIGRLTTGTSGNLGDKCSAGEPVYSTQLDGSDESSSYGAIGEPAGNKTSGWSEGSKTIFDRHLDFTLDGNRAERLGRAIAKAKRKRQWCRGLTAIFGLVFFFLSVIVVSLSVTRGRKVFGSM